MGFLKKPTPLWITLLVVVSLSLIALYFAFPSYRYREFCNEAFSTHLTLDSKKVTVKDAQGGGSITTYSEFEEYVTELKKSSEDEFRGTPLFWNYTVRLENGTYHMHYSIKMNGSDIAGTYSVRLTLENTSKLFNFTVATNEQLPRTFVFHWNTEVPPANPINVSMGFHSGWSLTPSFDRLLYLFILFLPEYFVAITLAITLPIVFLAYRLVKHRKFRSS
jgi:hypothetical protein